MTRKLPFRIACTAILICFAAALEGASLQVTLENLSATAGPNSTSNNSVAPGSSAVTSDGNAKSTTGGAINSVSVSETLNQSYIGTDSTAGAARLYFTSATSASYSLSGSVTLLNPFGASSFSVNLYDVSADNLIVYSYQAALDGTHTFSSDATLNSTDTYELVEIGSLLTGIGPAFGSGSPRSRLMREVTDPSLTSTAFLSLATAVPEPAFTAPLALIGLAGALAFRHRRRLRV